jgi:hypothetical protein
MQENIQDWLQLDEGDPGFWLLVLLAPPILLNFLSIYFISFIFLPFRAIFYFINLDYRLIQMTSHPNYPGLEYI